MATQWIPLTRFEPKSWLLGNGEIVSEPPLEQTSTGRKVRVVGTTESYYASGLDAMLGQAIKNLAAQKQTHILCSLVNDKVAEQRSLGFVPEKIKAKLHLIHEPTVQHGSTILWWRFKHPTMPFRATLVVTMQSNRYSGGATGQSIVTRLIVPSRPWHTEPYEAQYATVDDSRFTALIDDLRYRNRDLVDRWQEFLRDNDADWPTDTLGVTNAPQARAGVADLAKIVREFELLESINVPDLGDPEKPSWMTLELHDTNVSNEILHDLTEYLDSAPTVEQAADLYEQMMQSFRSIGIGVKGKTHNDFLAALLAGDKTSLNMEVLTLSEEGHRTDPDHKLSVHLPTGSFIVECNHNREVDKNLVAERWEEAKTVAALTGEEDELLAYARAYAKTKNERRTKEILKERQAP